MWYLPICNDIDALVTFHMKEWKGCKRWYSSFIFKDLESCVKCAKQNWTKLKGVKIDARNEICDLVELLDYLSKLVVSG